MAKPFVKWAGGKEKELQVITPNLPTEIKDYYEPFVGGGAVYFSLQNHPISGKRYINDKSNELISLYKNIAFNNQTFFDYLNQLEHNWTLLSDIVYEYKSDLIDFYNMNKKHKINKIELKDKINEFISEHRDSFNGMLAANFNVQIDSFYLEIVKALLRKIERISKLEGDFDFGEDNILEKLKQHSKRLFILISEGYKNPKCFKEFR